MSWRDKIRDRRFAKEKQKRNADTNLLLTPPTQLGSYLRQTGTFADLAENPNLDKLRGVLRKFATLNPTFSIVLRLTSLLASKNPRIVCQDSINSKKLNACFSRSHYQQFLGEFLSEYLLCGECTSYAYWNNEEKKFEDECILPPSTIKVKTDGRHIQIIAHEPSARETGAFSNNIQHFTPNDMGLNNFLERNDIPPFNGPQIEEEAIIRAVNKQQPWDLEGFPFFAPALTALVQKENLDAALFGQLNELATPLILGQIGLKAGELGPGQPAWVPTQAELNEIVQQIRTLMMGESRIGAFRIGVDFKNAFAGFELADLSKPYQKVKDDIMETVGAGHGLIEGNTGGTYASDAVNRDVYNSFISALRVSVIQAFQKRIDTAIRKLGLKAMRVQDGERKVTYRAYDGGLTFNRDEAVDPIPADEEAVLAFDEDVLRNANAELNTLETLIHSNVPISKQTLANAADLGIDIREELRQIRKEQEMVESTNTQQNVTLENNPGKTIYKDTTDVSNNPTERRFKGQ